MGRTENINVFQDTMNMCKDNDRIWESVHNSAEGQKLILEGAAIAEPDNMGIFLNIPTISVEFLQFRTKSLNQHFHCLFQNFLFFPFQFFRTTNQIIQTMVFFFLTFPQ